MERGNLRRCVIKPRCRRKFLLCVLIVSLTVLTAMTFLQWFQKGTYYVPYKNDSKQKQQRFLHNMAFTVPMVPFPKNTAIVQPKTANYSVCIQWQGRLGNNMFEYASSFGIAASKGMSLILSKDRLLLDVFKINQTMKDDKFIKKNCIIRREKYYHVYDKEMVNFTVNNNYYFKAILQSWKYFYNISADIRKEFVFIDSIQEKRDSIISSVLSKYKLPSRSNVTLIGLHMRRGDFLNFNKSGKSVANKAYLNRAVDYLLTKVQHKTIFLVCSDDMDWIKQNIPIGITAEFIEGESPGVDMAVLGSCDHMLSTSGSFSWWSGWLTGGIVTYYQWPDIAGAPVTKPFPIEYSEFFYPGWIGIP